MIKKRQQNTGFSLVEGMVVVVIMPIVFLGLSAFLQKSSVVTTDSFQRQEAQSAKLYGINWLTRDLRSAKRSLVGSWIPNGSFETEFDSDSPQYWASAAGGLGTFEYYKGELQNDSHTGFKSIGLEPAGGEVTYDLTDPIGLKEGVAYMVTGWVRSLAPLTQGKIILMDTNGTVVASSQTVSAEWKMLSFRYPDNGYYTNNQLNSDLVRVQLSADLGTSWVFFDDIALTPIHSVLMSTSAMNINTNSSSVDASDPLEITGFRFVRVEDNVEVLYRYRIQQLGGGNSIVREKYDDDQSTWIGASPSRLFRNINTLIFTYSTAEAKLPPRGKNTPINITMGNSRMSFTEKDETEILSMNIFPLME